MIFSAEIINSIIGRVASGFVLRVFPPFAEDDLASADVSFLLELDGEQWCLFCVSVGDGWTLEVCRADKPAARPWEEFNIRIRQILSGRLEPDYVYEFYDGTVSPDFSGIVNSRILSADFISCGGDVFALRLVFKEEFIIIYPNADGSAVETKFFKQGRGLKEFEYLGEISVSSSFD